MGFVIECAGQKWRLGDGSYVIGRHSDCDLRIADGRLSRHHARLTLAGDRAQILDLDSRNGIFINEERQPSGAIGPECNLRVGPFRVTMLPLHPDMDASGDADFMPMSATAAPRQALTDTFDPQASSSIALLAPAGDRGSTADMMSDAFAPQAQARLGGSALASPSWLRLATMRESSAGARLMAYLGDVGLQLPLAALLSSFIFLVGLVLAWLAHGLPNEQDAFIQQIMHLIQPWNWFSSSQQLLTEASNSVRAIWYLSISCALLAGGGYLALVLILPTIASGAPYWHRHYHLHICTRKGERPAVWQICLRWILSVGLFPVSLPLLLFRLPGLHDLLAGTRLRAD